MDPLGLGLLGIAVLILVKEAGLPVPVPGDLLVVGAGVAASQGELDAPLAFLTILVAGLVGGVIQFTLVRGAGREPLLRILRRVGCLRGATRGGRRTPASAGRTRCGAGQGDARRTDRGGRRQWSGCPSAGGLRGWPGRRKRAIRRRPLRGRTRRRAFGGRPRRRLGRADAHRPRWPGSRRRRGLVAHPSVAPRTEHGGRRLGRCLLSGVPGARGHRASRRLTHSDARGGPLVGFRRSLRTRSCEAAGGRIRAAIRAREAHMRRTDIAATHAPSPIAPVPDRSRRPIPVPADAVVDPRIGSHGPALLALEDGTVFPGVAFGAPVGSGGDLVVNTSQTGYQEVATDPSYAGQVVVMTYPAHRQPRAARRATTSPSGPGCAASSWRMPRRPCSVGRARSSTCCARRACRPSRAWTRGRSRATCARPAASGPRLGARRDRRRGGRRRPPVGCRAGRTRTSWARSRRRRRTNRHGGGAAGGGRRLRAQDEHRARSPPPRRARAGAAAYRHGRGGPGAGDRRRRALARPR